MEVHPKAPILSALILLIPIMTKKNLRLLSTTNSFYPQTHLTQPVWPDPLPPRSYTSVPL